MTWKPWTFFAVALAGSMNRRQQEAIEYLRTEIPVENNMIEIDNGLVKAVFEAGPTGVAQRYYAREGDGWRLLAEAMRPPRPFPEGGLTLYDSTRDDAARLIATEVLTDAELLDTGSGTRQVLLTGATSDGTALTQTVTLRAAEPFVHVELAAELAGDPPTLDVLVAPLTAVLDGPPDVTHAPGYKRATTNVIADRVFFAPAALVQRRGLTVALVPDLDVINAAAVHAPGSRQNVTPKHFTFPTGEECETFPTVMDLDLASGLTDRPLLACGLADVISEQHVFWNRPAGRDMRRRLATNRVRVAFDLFLSAGSVPGRGCQTVSRHLWRRYGRKYFRRPRPQAMPYAEYAGQCYPPQFAYQGYDVAEGGRLVHRDEPDAPELNCWQQWRTGDGRAVGGFRLHAPQWRDLVYFTAWWNNAGDAIGLYRWSRRLGNDALRDKARRIVELALSAPVEGGLFPSLWHLQQKRWIESLWRPPAEGFDPDAAEAYWDWNSGAYQTASASLTAGFLLRYRRECEEHPGILPFVEAYGEFLLEHLGDEGCVPAWFDENLAPLPSLSWNADAGAHAWVLAQLYRATGRTEYLDGARRAADFIIREVLPGQRWEDFEAFHSCAIKPETFRDEGTGMGGRNMMSLSWALEGLPAVYEAAGERAYLDAAVAAADYAGFFQAVWAPHSIVTAYPFGGLSSQVGDAEWLDQRSHRFAVALARLGVMAGRQDLLERGVAAGRASLTLVNHPRHVACGVYEHPNFPFGLGPENIDHEGYSQMPCGSGPSWSAVGGLAAMGELLDLLGGAYVNAEARLAVGVNGVRVDDWHVEGRDVHVTLHNQLSELTEPWDQPYDVELRVIGLPAGTYRLHVNDRPPVRRSAEQLRSVSVRIEP